MTMFTFGPVFFLEYKLGMCMWILSGLMGGFAVKYTLTAKYFKLLDFLIQSFDVVAFV